MVARNVRIGEINRSSKKASKKERVDKLDQRSINPNPIPMTCKRVREKEDY